MNKGVVRYRIIYADGHAGEWRSWESTLQLIHAGRVWRNRHNALMTAVRIEQAVRIEGAK